MALIENRVRKYHASSKVAIRNSYFPNSIFYILGVIIISVSIFFSVNFTKLSIIDIQGLIYARAINPANIMLQSSIHYITSILRLNRLHTENVNLKIENFELRQRVTELKFTNAVHKETMESINLYKFFHQNSIKAQVIYRITSETGGAAVISCGQNSGVKINDIVLSHGALAGRIVSVGQNYSKAMLINSGSSRIPVITTKSALNAILVGNTDQGGILLHLDHKAEIAKGELLQTSGEGDFYPRGILVGRVSEVSRGQVSIDMIADLNKIDLVEILSINQFFN